MSAPLFRTARKAHRCANANVADRGNPTVSMCSRSIGRGEQYEEGEIDPYSAGGFGHERYCMACVNAGQGFARSTFNDADNQREEGK